MNFKSIKNKIQKINNHFASMSFKEIIIILVICLCLGTFLYFQLSHLEKKAIRIHNIETTNKIHYK